MLKVKPPDGYPPEEGRYVRGNDYSPVAVCTILDTFDFAIPPELNELVMSAADAGAALSGMLQTENIGIEKIICNIVANPNIRYVVLCGRESSGHLPGEFFRCQVVGNRQVVKGVSHNKIIFPLILAIHDKPAAIFIEGSDPRILRHSQIFINHLSYFWIYLHNIDLCRRIHQLKGAGQGIPAAADEQGGEGS